MTWSLISTIFCLWGQWFTCGHRKNTNMSELMGTWYYSINTGYTQIALVTSRENHVVFIYLNRLLLYSICPYTQIPIEEFVSYPRAEGRTSRPHLMTHNWATCMYRSVCILLLFCQKVNVLTDHRTPTSMGIKDKKKRGLMSPCLRLKKVMFSQWLYMARSGDIMSFLNAKKRCKLTNLCHSYDDFCCESNLESAVFTVDLPDTYKKQCKTTLNIVWLSLLFYPVRILRNFVHLSSSIKC